jgi:hypothetical protein
MANRVRAGWGDWSDVMEQAPEFAAHPDEHVFVNLRSPALQGLLRDIDDIFYGMTEDETRKIVSPAGPRKPLLYWCNLLNKTVRPWFVETVIKNPTEHPMRAQVGMIMLYE